MSEYKTCFIIMPIADQDGYQLGHFSRVYEYLIKPAVEKAGFKPFRADDCQETNFIILNILQQIIRSDMALCDLSSLNPNVLYELGIRQSFDLPVTLIKDSRTRRIFDIQGLRDIEYDENLRVDNVKTQIAELADAITNTFTRPHDSINSIVQLLGMTPAKTQSTEISQDTSILLNAIQGISERLTNLELSTNSSSEISQFVLDTNSKKKSTDSTFRVGDYIYHAKWGEGKIIDKDSNGSFSIDFNGDIKKLLPQFAPISKIISKPNH